MIRGSYVRWTASHVSLTRFLSSTSHIILDEIHERDVLSDFLIIIARDLLPQRYIIEVGLNVVSDKYEFS